MLAPSLPLLIPAASQRLRAIIDDELSTLSHRLVDTAALEAAGGFTGAHFLPDGVDFGALGAAAADPLLLSHLERMQGVRMGTFGAFCENYRIGRRAGGDAPEAVSVMRQYLHPDILQLGYFRWWDCRDAWAQALVDEARGNGWRGGGASGRGGAGHVDGEGCDEPARGHAGERMGEEQQQRKEAPPHRASARLLAAASAWGRKRAAQAEAGAGDAEGERVWEEDEDEDDLGGEEEEEGGEVEEGVEEELILPSRLSVLCSSLPEAENLQTRSGG